MATAGTTAVSRARAAARWIEAVSWAFVLLGLALPVLFETALFRTYREAVARWAYGTPTIPVADQRLARLMLGITGGAIAGKWIVHALVARGALAEGRAWARDLTLRGLALWFFVDSAASIAVGALFNVWMINLVPVALVGVPMFLCYRDFRESQPPAATGGTARACLWASLFGVATGIGIAAGGHTPLFAPWFRGLELAQYRGAPLEPSARRLALLFFGPIGGCTIAQFVMLAGVVRHEGTRLRAALAGILSITGWFVIDSAYGLASSGMFNVLMVNVPGLAVTLPPWVAALALHGRVDAPAGPASKS